MRDDLTRHVIDEIRAQSGLQFPHGSVDLAEERLARSVIAIVREAEKATADAAEDAFVYGTGAVFFDSEGKPRRVRINGEFAMVSHTPLEISIGLHYWTRPDKFPDTTGVKRIKDEMVDAGLLAAAPNIGIPGKNPESDFVCTEALGVWVAALCAVPWPVQKWVMPEEGR